MDTNDKNRSVLDMEVEPFTTIEPKCWKLADHRLDSTLVTKPAQSPYTNRVSTAYMDQQFWENLSKVIGSGIGDMIQAQQRNQQTSDTPSAHAGCREFYSELEIVVLMGYVQVHTESGTPIIWGKFQMPKQCDDNHQYLMARIMYWPKKNGIDIDTAVLFFKLSIANMVKTKFNPGGTVAMYERTESGISPLMVIPRTTQDIEEYI